MIGDVDANSDHPKTKIANARQMKVHPAEAGLLIGNRDMEASPVRVHGKGNLGPRPRDEVIADLLAAIKEWRS